MKLLCYARLLRCVSYSVFFAELSNRSVCYSRHYISRPSMEQILENLTDTTGGKKT